MRASAVGFLLGVVWVHSLAALPTPAWGLAALPLLALGFYRPLRPFVVPAACLLLGFAWTAWRADVVLRDALPRALEGADIVIDGYIADLPRAGERGLRFRFDVVAAAYDSVAVTVPATVQLNIYDETFVARVGARWRFTVRLRRPHGFQNPGGFDYEAYLFRERIRAQGYVRTEVAPQLIADAPTARYTLGRLRQNLGDALHAALPNNPYTGMLIAFVNGDESGVDDTQWQVLQHTGTAHLLAISGMNIGWIALLAFALARRAWALSATLCERLPAPVAGAVAALFGALGYAALAGFAIPTQRALIMVVIVMGGVLLRRRTDISYLLAWALVAVLVHDPLGALAPGFWLSFISVAAIALLVQASGTARWRQWQRVQWGIAIALLPVLVLLFHQVPLASPLANLIAIPVVEVAVIPLALFGAAIVGFAPTAAGAVLAVGAAVLEMLWIPLNWLASFPALQWSVPAPSPLLWGMAVVGALWCIAPRGWPARGLGAIALAPMVLVPAATPARGELWLTLLDVGQGLAAVVRTHSHTLVYDTGPRFSARFDAGRAVVLPYLRTVGVERVDTLILSHGDNDHVGGAQALVAQFPPRELLSSVHTPVHPAKPCEAGVSWQWDEVTFTLLSPEGFSDRSANDDSCVLLIETRYGRVLLPGDITDRREALLVARYGAALAAEVLVAPHHGSKTSSSPAFLAHIAPRYVLLPVGYRNRYRHPHPTVLARYRERAVQQFDSAAAGAISLTLADDGIRISEYRARHRRYWFAD